MESIKGMLINLKGYKYRLPENKKRYFVIFISLMGYFLFFPRQLANMLRKTKIDSGRIKKILIVRNDGIGDFVMSLPALSLLRETYQRAHIAILIPNWQKEFALASNLFDEIVVFDDKESHYFSSSMRLKHIFLEMLRQVPVLKEKKFDLAIDIRGDIRNRIVIFLSAIPYRIGFDIGGMEYLLTHQVHYKGNVHEVEHFVDLISICTNRNLVNTHIKYNIPSGDDKIVEGFLKNNGIHAGQDYIVIVHPVSRWPAKEWTKAKFAELCDRLIMECQVRIIFVGSSEDTNSIKEILRLMKEKPSFTAGTLSLLQIAALIKRADLFIGNDAAPMHIAAAVKTQVIALFGPTDPEIYGPFGEGHFVVKPDVPCNCDSKKICKIPDYFCMDRIPVDQVFNIAKAILNSKTKPYPPLPSGLLV